MARNDNSDDPELRQYKAQLADITEKLKNDPSNAELRDLKNSIQELISLVEADSAEKEITKVAAAEHSTSPPPPPPPIEQKWSKENHPAFQAGYQKVGQPEVPAPKAPVILQVNDNVKAKWISGDKNFWNARIISITGSSHDPIYKVKFKGYDETDSVRAKDILPLSSETKKRKADEQATEPPPPPPTPKNTGVISGAASIDPTLASKAKEQDAAKEKHARSNKAPRQLKGQKELAANQNSWKNFQAKGSRAAKATKKESMFRSGDTINSRVGYVGSGKAMSKDPTRSRHIYEQVDDEDEE